MSNINNDNQLNLQQPKSEFVLTYKPEFIINNNKQNKKVLVTLEKELLNCSAFYISVAFITSGGIIPLLPTLKKLEDCNIPGKILTTDYMLFNDPKALDKLLSFNNISLKMYRVNTQSIGFHTKGYIFQKEETYKIMIGSSNLTSDAITKNQEWNMLLHTDSKENITKEIIKEFNDLWDDDSAIDYYEYEGFYKQQYNRTFQLRRAYDDSNINNDQKIVNPNRMQLEFLDNLTSMVNKGIDKALLISSTGTGKTYAAAFAARKLKPKKMLFLVHREQILNQAKSSFKRILGSENIKYGILSGNSKAINVDYLFSTVQMMSKYETHEDNFDRNEFDIIVIDEVHHAGAETYSRIMQYFKPKLWLGMTASPDTNNYDIYSLFDHNIVYEIRLQQAIEDDLVCPFHYFGIKEIFEDKVGKKDLRDFNKLVSDERVDYVLEKSSFYGFSGSRVKGLVFCSRIEEATELSRKFNMRGYRSLCLTGKDSQIVRENAIDRLTTYNNSSDNLDYIFTIDVFNEGVDIPEINQVIMLRPTQSPIIFIQQLGRGLRKLKNKEFVVILDFIGNYDNNFMIPIALSGDRSYNKDNLRKYITLTNYLMPGSATIHFDDVTKERIYKAIDSAKFSSISLIKNSYKQLKHKLGRIPNLLDFDFYGELDVLRIFDNNDLKSYYNFLVKYETDYKIRVSAKAEKFIEFVSRKFASGKRVHELILLKILISNDNNIFSELERQLKSEYGIILNNKTIINLMNIFTNNFLSGTGKDTYRDCIFIEKANEGFQTSHSFNNELLDDNFKLILHDLIEFGLSRYNMHYKEKYLDTNFCLYHKYTYEDVYRLLDWQKAQVAQNVGGYKYDEYTNTFPVFINYHKDDNILGTIKYEDRFLNNKTLIAISKKKRSLNSKDIKIISNAEKNNTLIHLFIRRNKDDKISSEFYYLGTIKSTGVFTPGYIENNKIVEIEYELLTPVREDIYEYITKTTDE